MTDRALFSAADDRCWTPTEFARGPWHPGHCHGGPVSALLARSVEGVDDGSGVDWQIARLTIELLRPVRVGSPLRVDTDVERSGRKVSLVAASLVDVDADEAEVARVRALRIRRETLPLPEHPVGAVDEMGEPGAGRTERSTWSLAGDGTAFHRDSCTHRWVAGSFADPGPCRVWIRLEVDVVPGERPTGLQRVAAAADFGNGVSGALPSEQITFINPDLTIHLARTPVGEWVGMASHSVYGVDRESSGMGWAESALYDEAGRVGRSVQSLILQPTP